MVVTIVTRQLEPLSYNHGGHHSASADTAVEQSTRKEEHS
jgi:hypothetical protein